MQAWRPLNSLTCCSLLGFKRRHILCCFSRPLRKNVYLLATKLLA